MDNICGNTQKFDHIIEQEHSESTHLCQGQKPAVLLMTAMVKNPERKEEGVDYWVHYSPDNIH